MNSPDRPSASPFHHQTRHLQHSPLYASPCILSPHCQRNRHSHHAIVVCTVSRSCISVGPPHECPALFQQTPAVKQFRLCHQHRRHILDHRRPARRRREPA